MATKVRTCGYNHCRCEDKEIPTGTEVLVSNRYYHDECAKICFNIREMKKQYFDNISNTVVQGVLGKVINNIVFDKNVSSEYFLYAIKYSIQYKIKINSPYGLHYLIDNNKIKESYNKEKAREVTRQMDINILCNPMNDLTFTRKEKEKSQIENMF